MKYLKQLKQIDIRIYMLIAITALGAGLRLYGRAWGLPLMLHPDEWQIVDGAMYMLQNHTWLPPEDIFQWPGHLMMYLSAGLYELYAAVKLHMPVELVYEQNPAVLYLLSRYVSIFFGTASIVLVYLILEKIKKYAGVAGALLVAIFPIFVIHSQYASADIPLMCVLLAAAWRATCYVEKPSIKNLLLMSFFTGMSVTVKYSGAAVCLGIGLAIGMVSWEKKSWKLFFAHGFLAAASFVLFTFLCSPVLFIKYEAVINILFWQAEHEHLSVEPQGFWMNLWFYVKSFFDYAGYEFAVFVAIGAGVLARQRRRQTIGIGFLLIYWVCLSCLSLYWIRWGVPIYCGFMMIGAVGVVQALQWCLALLRGGWAKKVLSAAMAAFLAVVVLSMAALMAVELLCQKLDDSQQVAVRFCAENQITADNAVSDGVDSLDTEGVALMEQFVIRDDKLMVKGESRNRQYLVMNSNVWGRYFSEPDKYADYIEIYNRIFDEFELVKEYGTVRKDSSTWALGRLAANVKYAAEISELGYTGGGIRIFRVPEDRYTDYVEAATLSNMSGMEEGETVFDTQGSEGYVVCGPYIELIPGSYLAKVTIALKDGWTEKTGEEAVTIDVSRGGGEQVYGQETMTAEELDGQGEVTVELPFTLTESAPGFEFRIYETENTQLLISDLSIQILE